MSKRRSSTRSADHFTQRAKAAGFPARSVFKLEEIDRRAALFKRGMRVLDLGAAPGSWALYAAQRVLPNGFVHAIDIQPMQFALPHHVHVEQADIFAMDLETLKAKGPFDVVMSDMAPHTSGQKHLDQYRSFELFMRAFSIATEVLTSDGAFLGKLFTGGEFPEAKRALTLHFKQVRVFRPEATRKESYELFLYGIGRKDITTQPD